MTISSVTSREDYTATARQTVFPYTFKILVTGELNVYVDGSLKAETADYIVSRNATTGIGNVTFLVAMVGGEAVAIVDVPDLTQLTSYSPNDAFPAKTHENALDKLTRIALYLKELLNKTISLPLSSVLTRLTLPSPVATYFLRWNAAADGLENMDISTIPAIAVSPFMVGLAASTDASTCLSGLGVTDYMKTLLDDTISTTALSTLGVSPFMQTMLDDTTSAAARTTLGSSNIVLQVISTTLTTTVTVSPGSATFTTVTGLAATITPSSATNKILVQVDAGFGMAASATLFMRVKRGETIIGVGDTAGSRSSVGSAVGFEGPGCVNSLNPVSFSYLDSPATLAATTYQVHMAPDQNYRIHCNRTDVDTDDIGHPRGVSTITLTEISA